MAMIQALRLEIETLQSALDISKAALSQLIEEHNALDPDPEFEAAFAMKEAEANYYITEAEKKLKMLKDKLEILEVYIRDI